MNNVKIKTIKAYPLNGTFRGPYEYDLKATPIKLCFATEEQRNNEMDMFFKTTVETLTKTWKLSFKYVPKESPCVAIVKYSVNSGSNQERAFVLN